MTAPATLSASPPARFRDRLRQQWRQLQDLANYGEGWAYTLPGLLALKPVDHFTRVAEALPDSVTTIADPFCGIGGSAIGLAKGGRRVLASDLSPTMVRLARQNAATFLVADRVSVTRQDARRVVANPQADAIHLDAPWTTVDVNGDGVFQMNELGPFHTLIPKAVQATEWTLVTVPDKVDVNSFRLPGVSVQTLSGAAQVGDTRFPFKTLILRRSSTRQTAPKT